MTKQEEFNNVIIDDDIEIIKTLLKDNRVDPSDRDNYAIKVASTNGHTETVKLLLQDDRVDPSDNNNMAIRWASNNGCTGVVKLLLKDDRVDPSDDDNFAIRGASNNGHTEVVKLLLKDSRIDIYKLLKEAIPNKLREEINDFIINQRQDNINIILNIPLI